MTPNGIMRTGVVIQVSEEILADYTMTRPAAERIRAMLVQLQLELERARAEAEQRRTQAEHDRWWAMLPELICPHQRSTRWLDVSPNLG